MFDRTRALLARQSVRSAAWVLAGHGFNFLTQAAYFILLARVLGAAEYGIFVGVFALVSIVSPYTGLGGGLLFMRYVTQNRELAPVYWGNSLLLTSAGTFLICLLSWWVGPALTHDKGLPLVLANVVAACLFNQVVNTASRIFQTYERMAYSSALLALTNITRLGALVFLYFTVHHATATQWAVAWVIACSVPFMLAVILAQKMAGGIAFAPRLLVERLREGLVFSLSLTSVSIYNDFDKTILSKNGLNLENGFYTLGYRVIDFATAPLIAMDTALLPRYFQSSELGVRAVAAKAFRGLGIAAPLGLGIAALLWVTAPLVPRLAGPDFAAVPQVVRWLCLIPLLRGLHMISGSAVTGMGKQHLRMATQVLVALWNVGLNLWLIPRYGWVAACWTSLASDSLMAVINLCMITWFRVAPNSLA